MALRTTYGSLSTKHAFAQGSTLRVAGKAREEVIASPPKLLSISS